MSTVQSSDGTAIAYTKSGDGPALILVDGALCHREFGPSKDLAAELEPSFTVYRYDRRGRGQSGDTQPWSVEREVDDLAALIEEAGGSAFVYGISSGAALALEAADRIPGIERVAGYEPPFAMDDSAPRMPDDFVPRMDEHVAAGRPGEAAKMFMRHVGAPRVFLAVMPLLPMWKKLKGVAHTLPNDMRIVERESAGRPPEPGRWGSLTAPTLMMAGGKSDEWMQNAARAVADALPNAEYRTIEGQNHMLKAKAIAPVLVEYFGTKTMAPAVATAS
jgi:pimeloyl-ACP methyl ester carboxylesterase